MLEYLKAVEGTSIRTMVLFKDTNAYMTGFVFSVDEVGLCLIDEDEGNMVASPWEQIQAVKLETEAEEPAFVITARDEDFLWLVSQLSSRLMAKKGNGTTQSRLEYLSALTKKALDWRNKNAERLGVKAVMGGVE